MRLLFLFLSVIPHVTSIHSGVYHCWLHFTSGEAAVLIDLAAMTVTDQPVEVEVRRRPTNAVCSLVADV